MKLRHPHLILTLGLLAGAPALAADPMKPGAGASGATANAPAKATQQGTQPSVQNMDANAQRAHSRDPAKAQQPPAAGSQPSVGTMDANAQRAHSRKETAASGPAGAGMRNQAASASKP